MPMLQYRSIMILSQRKIILRFIKSASYGVLGFGFWVLGFEFWVLSFELMSAFKLSVWELCVRVGIRRLEV